MKRRTERIASLIRDLVAEAVLRKLSDPRIDPARTSITRVEVPEDLLTAKVFVSVLGTAARQRTALRALQHASGRFQEMLGHEIRLRHTPRLSFEIDEQFKKTQKTLELIQQAMDEIHEKERQEAPDATDEPVGDDGPQ